MGAYSNIRFFYNDIWKNLAIETSPSYPNFPGENTKTRRLGETWLTLRRNNQYIRSIDGAGVTVQGFFIFGHNVPEDSTILLKATDAVDWDFPDLEVEMTWSAGCIAKVFDNPQTFNNWGIFIDNTNPTGNYEIGRIFSGQYFEPEYGFQGKGLHEFPVDPSIQLQATDGALWTIEKEKYKTWNLSFNRISEIAAWNAMIDEVGTSKAFVIQKKPHGDALSDFVDTNAYYVHFVGNTKPLVNVDTAYAPVIQFVEER